MVYAVIGQGKLASHLCHWLQLEGLKFISLNRESDYSELIHVDTILLAVSDIAIKSLYLNNTKFHNKTWVHFSGAIEVRGIFNLHPMMSFSTELFDIEFYQNLCWVTTNQLDLVEAVMPIKKSKIKYLNSDDKRYYHALCVLAGNIPHLLWNQLETSFQNLNIEKEDLKKYVSVATENFLKDRPVTGPIARGDSETIEKNLLSLSPKYQNVYKSVMELTHEKY